MSPAKQRKKESASDLTPRMTRDFVSMAAHDLREPLRAIRAHAQFLATLPADEEANRRDQCIRFLHDGVDRMERLIHDIEDYCLEEIRELNPKEISMESVLQEARRQMSDQIEDCGALLTNARLPAVTGDFEGLTTVFRVLIDNACKFRNAEPPRIQIAAVRDGPDWVFSVQDNGQGFNPAYAELIFEPFERLHGKRYPGSGLGLPLAKRVVERHRGRIWAESTPDFGSTFRFALK
jgi:light-regulated signal transduction histidine kinase (bacteriophytochrome)